MRTALGIVIAVVSAAWLPEATAQPVVGVAVAGRTKSSVKKTIRSAVRRALQGRSVLLLTETREHFLFDKQGPRKIDPPLSAADKNIAAARRAFAAFKLDRAKRHIREAEKNLKPWLGRPEARDTDRDRLVLQISIAHALRDEPTLDEAIAEYAQRFGDEGVPEGAGWPPTIRERFESQVAFGETVLTVSTIPTAEIFVDGRAMGRSPVTIADLRPGNHRLVARSEGYDELDQTATTLSGRPTELSLELPPRLHAVLRRHDSGAVLPEKLVEQFREATRVDGLDSMIVATPLDQGAVSLRMVALSDQAPRSEVQQVRLSSIEDERAVAQAVERLLGGLPIGPPPSTSSFKVPTWAWITAGIGVAAAGVGTGLRVSAASDQSDLQARINDVTQVEAYDIRDRAESKATAGTVMIGLGAATVAGTITYLVIDHLIGSKP